MQIPWTDDTYEDVLSYIEAQWGSGENVNMTKIETALRYAYDQYNETVNNFSADMTMNASTATVNGTNTFVATNGAVSFINGSTLNINPDAILNIASQDNKISFDETSVLNLSGTLNGNVNGGTVNVNSAASTVNGSISDSTVVFSSTASRLKGSLSGAINLKFLDDFALSNVNTSGATLGTVTIADGKTLDIGEGTLTANDIKGGILNVTLTDAARTSPIITANASGVQINLDMKIVPRDEVVLYHITSGTGYSLGQYDADVYAVSGSVFDIANAKKIPTLSGWRGGDLYIIRLASEIDAALKKLKDKDISISENEESAIQVLNNDVISRMEKKHKEKAENINAKLEEASIAGDTDTIKQILREITPEEAPTSTQLAYSNANAVFSAIDLRMSGNYPAPWFRDRSSSSSSRFGRGRSGGEFAESTSTVWVQGLHNKAELDTKENGFDSNSTGVAAGVEHNINNDVKIGAGYAYTVTDINTTKSKTDVDTHTAFIYGEYMPNEFYLNGIVSYGYSMYKETTKLMKLKSKYDENVFSGKVAAGYTFGNLITPEIGVRYTNVDQKSYKDALGVKLSRQIFSTWTGFGGVKLSRTLRKGRLIIVPEVKAMATYDFKSDDLERKVTLQNEAGYVTKGTKMKRLGVEAGAGFSMSFGKTEVGLFYKGAFKKDYTDHTGLFNFKYNF